MFEPVRFEGACQLLLTYDHVGVLQTGIALDRYWRESRARRAAYISFKESTS